eukprot:tig00000737_g3792.t1
MEAALEELEALRLPAGLADLYANAAYADPPEEPKQVSEFREAAERRWAACGAAARGLERRFVSAVLVRWGAYGPETAWWSSAECRRLAGEAVAEAMRACGAASAADLVGPRLAPLLQSLVEDMKRWRQQPDAARAALSLIVASKFPHVGPAIDVELPMCLNVLDDYRVESKTAAVLALHHVVRESTPSQLRWHGDLILHTLEGLLTYTDAPLVAAAVPCLLDALAAIMPLPPPPAPPSPASPSSPQSPSSPSDPVGRLVTRPRARAPGRAAVAPLFAPSVERHFAILERLLDEVWRPSSVQNKVVHIRGVQRMVSDLGTRTAWHLKRAAEVAGDALGSAYEATLLAASADLVRALADACPSRIAGHLRDIVRGLAKAYAASDESDEASRGACRALCKHLLRRSGSAFRELHEQLADVPQLRGLFDGVPPYDSEEGRALVEEGEGAGAGDALTEAFPWLRPWSPRAGEGQLASLEACPDCARRDARLWRSFCTR